MVSSGWAAGACGVGGIGAWHEWESTSEVLVPGVQAQHTQVQHAVAQHAVEAPKRSSAVSQQPPPSPGMKMSMALQSALILLLWLACSPSQPARKASGPLSRSRSRICGSATEMMSGHAAARHAHAAGSGCRTNARTCCVPLVGAQGCAACLSAAAHKATESFTLAGPSHSGPLQARRRHRLPRHAVSTHACRPATHLCHQRLDKVIVEQLLVYERQAAQRLVAVWAHAACLGHGCCGLLLPGGLAAGVGVSHLRLWLLPGVGQILLCRC